MGIEDALPPLAMSDIVMGELSALVDLIVKGKKGTAMRPYGVMLNEESTGRNYLNTFKLHNLINKTSMRILCPW